MTQQQDSNRIPQGPWPSQEDVARVGAVVAALVAAGVWPGVPAPSPWQRQGGDDRASWLALARQALMDAHGARPTSWRPVFRPKGASSDRMAGGVV